MQKVLLICGGVLLALVLTAGGVILVVKPAAIAEHCPQCFGFRAIGSGIYVQDDATASPEQIAREVRSAGGQVKNLFGTSLPPVRVLICSTELCYRRVEGRGGISKAVSWWDRALIVSPRGQNVTIMAHEFTHIEFRHLLGMTAYAKVPSWFDEGLAVYVADDRRYLAPIGSQTRCLVSGGDTLPTSHADWWGVMTRNPARAYALAACRVSAWMDQNGGRNGLLEQIRQLRNGQDVSFAF
jgi:hypothetical protein